MKCVYKIYNRLRLPGKVIHFEYNNNESANVVETLFKQIYDYTANWTGIGNAICLHLDPARSSTCNRSIVSILPIKD